MVNVWYCADNTPFTLECFDFVKRIKSYTDGIIVAQKNTWNMLENKKSYELLTYSSDLESKYTGILESVERQGIPDFKNPD